MRTYEFAVKLRSRVRLGEAATSMFFIKKDSHYTPAVLCVKPKIHETEYIFDDILGLIYWDNVKKEAVRIDIPFAERKLLPLPVKAGTVVYDGTVSDSQEISIDDYYVVVEKICCALEIRCVTQGMKDQYQKIVSFKDNPEMEKIYRHFFPDAMEQLFSNSDEEAENIVSEKSAKIFPDKAVENDETGEDKTTETGMSNVARKVFDLPDKRSLLAVFFWMLDLSERRWPNSSLSIKDRKGQRHMVTKGLNAKMYACLYPVSEIAGLYLECTNGDSLLYDAKNPDSICVEGMKNFLEQFPIDVPDHSVGEWNTENVVHYTVNERFSDMSSDVKMRQLFRIAGQSGGKFSFSSRDTHGKLIPIVSRNAIDGYNEMLHVVIWYMDGGWLLWEDKSEVVFSYAIHRNTLESWLDGII